MRYFYEFLIFIICFNLIFSFIKLDEKPKDSSKATKQNLSFEEFDQIMSNSEFSKAWEKFRDDVFKNGGSETKFNEPLDGINTKDAKPKTLFAANADDNTNECLLSKEETAEIIKNKTGKEFNDVSDEARFIFGKCNPIILVPGMLSTKLQVRINCKNIYNNEIDIFKKIRFYCGDMVCEDENEELEEHNLFLSGLGAFQLTILGDANKYSACTGYFLTFFNSKKACSSYDEDKDDYTCNYSENIRIVYYGGITESKSERKCGLNAVKNVVMVPSFLEEQANTGMFKSYGPLIDRLEKQGYKAGFSLAAIPNDYREFLANNNFTINAFRYQVEKLYENTGKKVVLIGHSHGTNTFYSNLMRKENEDILPKIKKFVAVGPPFAGSSELLDLYFNGENKYQTTISAGGAEIDAGFDNFGFGFIINKLPLVFELRPQPIIGNLFTNPQYETFVDAIKERFYLEQQCGHTQCDDSTINKYSEKFSALFKDYFPLLTDEDCKFESDLNETGEVFNRKCLMEMRNVFECPMAIEETRDADGNLPNDYHSYCGLSDSNLFYQKDCDNSEKQCLDQTYWTHVLFPFDESSEKLQWFKTNWNNENYNGTFGDVDSSFYEQEEKYKATPKKQIDYFEEISITKDLPTPTVDVDIIYSTYNPSNDVFIFDKNDWSKDFIVKTKGGDGTVPNWSPLISGLKWIYDTQRYNSTIKIKLIELCSRLGKNSTYSFDPTRTDQKFIALSCDCIDENNMYTSTNCSHTLMIADSAFYSYVDYVINDPNVENEITNEKIDAFTRFNETIDYEEQCDDDYLVLLEASFENETSSIVEEDTKEQTLLKSDTKENALIPESTEKVFSSSYLPEQITNEPSTNQEDITLTTTSSPDEKIQTTNLAENPKSTIIENVTPKTEDTTSEEKNRVILVGLSHVKIEEKIISFFIYFGLYDTYAGAKKVKFPVEFTSRRVLRLLETQEAECELVESATKGDLSAYSCEAQANSNQNIKNIKIHNQFEFSSRNNSFISASYSPFIEQYLDNIQGVGNKYDYLLNSTLYTLESPQISQGENQIFIISGVINDPKPKFGKVDLNLSVPVKYENKTEEKVLQCNIIDITGNNYTLSCFGIKDTNFSLTNAMSVIGDEVLIIRFDENANSTIIDYSDENTTTYNRWFNRSKSSGLGTGSIVAIILACVAAVAALTLAIFCIRKGDKGMKENMTSTNLNLGY